jgi:hypothetical protein
MFNLQAQWDESINCSLLTGAPEHLPSKVVVEVTAGFRDTGISR